MSHSQRDAFFNGLPVDDESAPVFREPWQAQAFAMAVALCERGVFEPTEWTAALSAEIAAAAERGEADDGDGYYEHWLRALESLLTSRGVTDPVDVDARQHAWHDAHKNTPHGEPVALANAVANAHVTPDRES